MTYEEILDGARHLPLVERLRLVEEVSRSVREAVADEDSTTHERTPRAETRQEERQRLLKDVPADSSLHQLLGIGRTTRDIPVTKEDVRQIITDHLMEKYG